MSDTPHQIFNKAVIIPFKNNLTSVLFWGGLFSLVIGAILGAVITNENYILEVISEIFLKGGSAILGAGIFSVIMKSSQFTDLFQKHISDVFYRPESIKNGVPLIQKWRLITEALLKEVLPSTHLKASSEIEQQFFNSELEYHFEGYDNSYTVTIDNKTNIATIELHSKTTIILSPHATNPILKQSIETSGDFEVLALRMNNVDIFKSDLYVKEGDKNILLIPLLEHVVNRGHEVRTIQFEKVLKFTQNLSTDPCIAANISRYIKGSVLRIKTPSNCNVFFKKFGLGELPENAYLKDDGEGFERWILAEPENLLLPGQGYILILIPLNSTGD